MALKVAVVGATGRMGALSCRLIENSDDLELAATLDSKSDLAEILQADVVLDFSIPATSPKVVSFAIEAGKNVLVGTSGWGAKEIEAVRKEVESSQGVGVLIVPNFSIGSVLATRFATTAAKYLRDFEIVETHASTKLDSPSGTAIRTAEQMASARGAQNNPGTVPASKPQEQRARGQLVEGVPVHSIRYPNANAKQQVILAGEGEVLRIEHEAVSLTAYEAGILASLRYLPKVTGVQVGLDVVLGLAPLLSEGFLTK
ncbi:MAG: 4-hydroxy-tetrahydrodipicolinate reductase [Microbacteriaceae bacterium]|nr:4-hydroxy-tetrahydrodipicolinate reductase [Cryobacterium sp.]MCC6376398.1 4-hydroxy-tetrahydrodipicolinate reductase [Microbacteriaceae bacterium]